MLHDIVTFPPLFLFYLLDSPYLCPQNSNNALGGKCLTILTHDFMKTINGMLLVVITALFGILCGCSQEDDGYDNADMYTLAEMGTRISDPTEGGGNPGGGGDNNTMYQADFVFKDVEFCSDAFPLAPNIRIDVSTQIRCSFNGTMNCVTYISHSLMFLDDIDSVNIVHSMARPWLINTNYMEISADFIAQKWEHNDTLGWDTIHYSGHATAKIPKSKFSSYN